MSVSVFAYDDPVTYLREWFDARKRRNKRYSHRVFARQAALKSPSALVNVLSGRRRLTDENVAAFARALKLTAAEQEHLALLAACAREADPARKARLRESVRISRKRALVRELTGNEPDFLSNWYEPTLLELARCAGFRPDPEWIAAHLASPVHPTDVAAAIDTLLRLGLLARTEDGGLVAQDVSVKTPEIVQGLSVRLYHEGMLERAREALTRVWAHDPGMPADECWFGGLTMAVPASQLTALRQEIVELQHRLMARADAAEGARERVVQFHLMLFPLARTDATPGQ